ncbi:hypothetical protein [Streptomyces sp. YS-3]|uniref:hypothetical protein n=1 Tax=Streptomyces sp. YS-3 TaxID=3381352 RepID=UPI0038626C09
MKGYNVIRSRALVPVLPETPAARISLISATLSTFASAPSPYTSWAGVVVVIVVVLLWPTTLKERGV